MVLLIEVLSLILSTSCHQKFYNHKHSHNYYIQTFTFILEPHTLEAIYAHSHVYKYPCNVVLSALAFGLNFLVKKRDQYKYHGIVPDLGQVNQVLNIGQLYKERIAIQQSFINS